MLERNCGHSCDVGLLTMLSVDIVMGLASVVDDWMSIDQWWHYSDSETRSNHRNTVYLQRFASQNFIELTRNRTQGSAILVQRPTACEESYNAHTHLVFPNRN
jgi:hypothetical protein